MPRKVVAWACKWRCGRRATTKRKGMEEHEARCLRNPKRKACHSCKHDSDDWTEPWCELEVRPDGKAYIVDCPRHELKDTIKEDPNETT